MTTFVDRERETALALEVLGRSRVLTIVGDEGSGKSRLAAEVARIEAGRDPERAPVVDLRNVGSDALVPGAVARRLGVTQARPRVMDALVEHLRDRDLLLVLDGGETVRHGCAGAIERLLTSCPQLRFLVTGREPLRVVGESVLHVAGLGVPGVSAIAVDDVTRSPAVRLFVDRLQTARPGVELTDDDVGLVADLCRRLDGIPLALELAASRVRTESLTDVVASVAERFSPARPGTGRGGDVVRDAVAWIVETLPEQDLVVLRRVSVLADFDVDAAVAVCLGDLDATAVRAALERLALDHLLVFDAAAERYSMLDAIRERARAHLVAAGEQAEAESAAIDHFEEVVTSAHAHLSGADQREWLDRLERDHDNIRRCVQLLLADRGDRRGARLAGLLWRYWYIRGYLLEGRLWLRLALDVLAAAGGGEGEGGEGDGDLDELRAACLHGAGTLAWAQGDYEAAQADLDRCIDLRRRLGDGDRLADTLNNRGAVAINQGDYDRARSLLEESLALSEASGSPHSVARALTNLGYVTRLQGRVGRAAELLGDAYEVLRDEGDTRSLTIVLSNIGAVRLAQGDTAAARQAIEEGLGYARELTAKESTAILLGALSTVTLVEGDAANARRLAEESLAVAEELGQRQLRADALWRNALIDVAERRWASARQLIDQALALGEDPHLRASCLATRARAEAGEGDTRSAVNDARQSLRVRAALGDELGEIDSLSLLGDLVGEQQAAAYRASLSETSTDAPPADAER